jgi:hypothetical protein
MPMHAIAQREYIYHNQNRGSAVNQNKPKDPKRVDLAPIEAQNPAKYGNGIKVEMDAYGDGDEES